jgi:hypothetical protein
VRLNLYFDLLPENTNVNGQDVVDYLRLLRQCLPGPLTVIGDRSRTHNRLRAVRTYLAEHPEVVMEGFPGIWNGRPARSLA